MSKLPQVVIALDRIALGDQASALVRIPLALLGRFVKGAQRFAITRADLATVVANFRKRQADTVIDYDHASEFPETAQGQPIPAAGWLKQIEDAPDERGVLWGLAEFTERARAMIQAREYKYLSPVIAWGARDKSSGEQQGATLTSMALTNRPFLEAMPTIQLSEAGWQIDQQEERVMDPIKLTLADGVVTAVCGEQRAELRLPAADPLKQPKLIALSDVKRGSDGRMLFSDLQTGEGVVIAAEVFNAYLAQDALDKAVAAGKITPAQRPHYEKLALSDLPAFNELVKSMKPQVELGERGFAGDGGAGTGELARIDQQLDQKVKEKMAASSGKLSYGEAYKLVASEHRDLAQRRLELIQGGRK